MRFRLSLTALLLISMVACIPPTAEPMEKVDCGPQPTAEEAMTYAKVVAEHYLWGVPNTGISDLGIADKTRWYVAITDHWPRGKHAGPTIEGWRITFTATPRVLKVSSRRVEILVDKNKTVHWRTQQEFNERNGTRAQPVVVKSW